MNTTNIIQRMIDDKVAQNPFQAAHIANGLHLALLKDEAAQVKRYKLYRRWRDAGEPSKIAYVNAIEGREPMEIKFE